MRCVGGSRSLTPSFLGIFRVKYCSTGCQSKDYPSHSAFCKAWPKIRPSPAMLDSFPSLPAASVQEVLSHMASTTMKPLELAMGEAKFNKTANHLAFREARCAACFRLNGQEGSRLAYCDGCKIWGWCAGRAGCQEKAMDGHVAGGSCQTLQEISQDEAFLL